jgi:hypothetical protein
VKEFLSRAGASFTAKNVDEDDIAYDELVARGFRTIPVTFFDANSIKGFDAAALEAALAEYRARS